MVGIVLKNSTARNRFKHITEKNILFGHLLLHMLRDPDILNSRLCAYPSKRGDKIIRIMHRAPLRWGGCG